jgi:DNA-binding protein YbaB
MQEQLQAAQEQLAEATVDGSVAGGAVTVTVSGTGDLRGVTIRPGTVDGDDAESLSDLSDLVIAAYRDAKAQADALAGQALGPLAGGGLEGFPGLPGQGGAEPGAGPGRVGF